MSDGRLVKGHVFILEHTVYFNETNAVGGVAYFSNFVKWQGMTREEYFIRSVPSWRDVMKFIQNGELNMITVEEHSHFIQHAHFGDKIIIRLQTTNIRKFSFDIVFIMLNGETEQVIYEGFQRLAFDNFHGKFVPIPAPMLSSVCQYEMDANDEGLIRLRKYFHMDGNILK